MRFQPTRFRKPLTWLLIGLVCGQVPSFAYAVGCLVMDDMSCCCSQTGCTAPTARTPENAISRNAAGCSCAMDAAPLPTEAPAAPAERADATPLRVAHASVPSAFQALTTTDSFCRSFHSAPPPTTSTLTSIRVVVLLI